MPKTEIKRSDVEKYKSLLLRKDDEDDDDLDNPEGDMEISWDSGLYEDYE